MLKIKQIAIKNFMSIGDSAEVIDFADKELTLILGENLDTSNDISVGRNGCGKCLRGNTTIDIEFKNLKTKEKLLNFLKNKK